MQVTGQERSFTSHRNILTLFCKHIEDVPWELERGCDFLDVTESVDIEFESESGPVPWYDICPLPLAPADTTVHEKVAEQI